MSETAPTCASEPSQKKTASPYFATPHALLRYQEHHPSASPPDVIRAFLTGLEVERCHVLQFIDRRWADGDSFYVLSRDFRGCFVMDRERTGATGRFVAVTYLRLADDVSQRMRARFGKQMGYAFSARHVHMGGKP